jgi:hypothetical protein
MWHILSAKYVRLIKCVYHNSESAVLVGGDKSNWIKVETGVRQGCIWSPLLFGLLVDFVLQKARDNNRSAIYRKECMGTLFGLEPAPEPAE